MNATGHPHEPVVAMEHEVSKYAGMLFGVAMKFTGNRVRARRLTEDAIRSVLDNRCSGDTSPVKGRLLKRLRSAYMHETAL